MASLLWKKEYSIGIKTIDDQHKSILMVFNSFLLDASPDNFKKTYGELGRLVDMHFAHEEEIMMKFKVPNYLEHKQWHDAARTKYLGNANIELTEENIGRVRGLLYGWIVDHILNDKMDRGIAAHLKRNGIYRI